MKPDQEATEFFVKAMWAFFNDCIPLAQYNFSIALLSLQVNKMYKEHITKNIN